MGGERPCEGTTNGVTANRQHTVQAGAIFNHTPAQTSGSRRISFGPILQLHWPVPWGKCRAFRNHTILKAELPFNEAERIEALREYQILDTLPEVSYDDMSLLASEICGTPLAMVSLIDSNRQWFKSTVGVEIAETPRDVSFCGHAILSPDLLVVPDTQEDRRFSDNPFVTGEPWIRFYAGAPLLAPGGEALGTVCVMDRVPRTLTETQANALRALSRQVMALLELRRHIRLQEEQKKTLEEMNVRLKAESLADDVTGFHNTRFLHEYLDHCFELKDAELTSLSLIFF